MSDQPPIIGLTTYHEVSSWGGLFKMGTVFTPERYVTEVLNAGAEPVLVPTALGAHFRRTVTTLNGLIIVGGVDVCPINYGAEAEPESQCNPVRDRGELQLLSGALEVDLPVLGICRGMQLLNIHLGGTLIQHLPRHLGHHEHLPTPGTFAQHTITIAPDSWLSDVMGGSDTNVTTYHHQAVDSLGRGLRASAWAQDGVIEAIESEDRRFVVGVQWHAEQDRTPSLIGEFVSICRERVAS